VVRKPVKGIELTEGNVNYCNLLPSCTAGAWHRWRVWLRDGEQAAGRHTNRGWIRDVPSVKIARRERVGRKSVVVEWRKR